MLKLKSGDIILNDIISIAYLSAITFQSVLLYISALAGFPVFIMFLATQFINCMLAQNNGLQILLKLIALTVVSSNYSQLRALYNFVSSNCFRLQRQVDYQQLKSGQHVDEPNIHRPWCIINSRIYIDIYQPLHVGLAN